MNMKSLGEVCDIINGGTPKSSVADYWEGDVLWITPKDLGKLETDYVSETSRKITELGLAKSSAKLIPKNSVILSTRAPIGHLAINEAPMATNQGCRGLVPSASLDNKYLFFFLRMSVKHLNDLGSGTTFKELSKTALSGVKIPLPSLPEQKRIVAILDEAFAGIDQAIANTEKNLAFARELFESTSRSLISNTQDVTKITLLEMIEKGWIISHLDGNHGGDYPRKHEFIEEGVPYISANCLKKGEVDFEKAKYLSLERAAKLRKGIAQNRDVLFAHNATVGPVALLRTAEEKVILGTSLTYYRCNEQNIIPEYLLHYLKSPEFIKQYKLVMGQSTRNQVPITKQREFYHFIPPLDKQKEIAEELDKLFDEVKLLELGYQHKLSALNELKQSLLQKAFSGELTAEMTDEVQTEAVA